ncbi:unnamed protein product [Durusdinium trenchii]|uniref:Uncharacterized protein n=1 Tax=Durusdinium trenchii TaxID=1381693 RepID=A0ABP0STQ6_9DINO
MFRRLWILMALCAATDVQVVDMFRAAKNPVSSGKETRNMTNNNLADIQGVLRYLHQEIVVEHAQGDPQRTERKYGIDSIARYRVSVRNPNSIDAKAPILGFSPAFTAFDYGVATSPSAANRQVGDFVGIQRHDQSDVAMIVAYPYYWFSLPGLCPNLPWTCIKGSSKPNCPKKASDVGVVPQVCQDRGCAGKKDEEAQKCQANFSDPDSLGDCCLRYSNGDEKEQAWISTSTMGTKVAVMYAFCSVFALVLQSIATQIKWHSLRFMNSITSMTLMKMETGLLYTRVDTGSSLLCFYRDQSRLKPGMCDRLSEGITLQDAADEWCSPLLIATFPAPCEGFKMAYFMGMGALFAMALNVVAIIVCLFLIAQYLEGTLHKGSYRLWAMGIHIIATLILLGSYAMYIILAIRALDDVGGKGVPLLAMASKGTGMSLGVVVMGAGLIFQILAAALLVAVKLGDEETKDEKEVRKWMKEDARWAQEGGYGGEYGSWGYGESFQATQYEGYDPNHFAYDPNQAAFAAPQFAAATPWDAGAMPTAVGADPMAASFSKVVIQGGLCEGPPTGQHGCVYSYPALEDKDVMSLDELVGIPSMKCGASGERACTDWADWRKNCYDPENKYKKRFQKTDNPDKTMKVEVVATDYCVEYDLHPYCQDREGLCTNVDCQGLTDSEKEIGLPFWLGRCEEGQNTKRAEAIARKALGQENLKNHVMVDKELLTSNFKCGSGSGMCKPNPDGGPYCSRQFGGVCTPLPHRLRQLPFQNAAQFVTCPFDVLAIGGYTPPQGTECKSQDAADICCLYGIGGGCSKSYADGSSADLTVAGFLGVMAASLKDPDQMYNFAVHWIQENGGKVEKEDQLKEEVYWMWRIHPSKRAAEEWDKFQENLKASSAVSFPDEPGKPTDEPGEPTEEPPGETTVSPGAQTTPSPGPDDEPPARPFPIWTIVAAVGAAAFLVAGWFYLYRNPNQRRGSSVEEDRRSLPFGGSQRPRDGHFTATLRPEGSPKAEAMSSTLALHGMTESALLNSFVRAKEGHEKDECFPAVEPTSCVTRVPPPPPGGQWVRGFQMVECSATTGSSHGVLKAVAGSSAVRLGVVRGAAVRGAEGSVGLGARDLSGWSIRVVGDPMAMVAGGALTRTARIPPAVPLNSERIAEGKQRWIAELKKRVEKLVPSLNFLLLQTLKRDSCVHQVVQNTQDLLFDVCSFVERWASPDATRGVSDVELLDHYLNELEFACLSVTMAVNVLHAAEDGQMGVVDGRSSLPSLKSLLRASQRIQDVYGQIGELSASRGELYSQAEDGAWTLLLGPAILAVRADEVPGFLRYGLQVSPGLSVQEDEASDDVRLWDFRIEVALDAQLLEAQELQLTCVAPGCEVLRWKGGCFESRAACDFPDAELVEEDAGSSPSSRSFWQRRHQRLLSAGLSPGEVAEGSSSYAFVFDDDSCDAAVLQPREVLLMARLCAFDTGHQQFTKFDAEERSCPPHLQSSDELIALLTAFHTA